jgi:hypothetical protein
VLRNNLASLYRESGQFFEAESLYREVVLGIAQNKRLETWNTST